MDSFVANDGLIEYHKKHRNMTKFAYTGLFFFALCAVLFAPGVSFAQDAADVAELLRKIQELQAQLETLRAQVSQPSNVSSVAAPQAPVLLVAPLPMAQDASVPNELGEDLYFGLRGPDVTRLQEFLMKEGHFGGPVSGIYLQLTADAVKRFQAAQGISATGYFGPLTRAALRKRIGSGAFPTSPFPTPAVLNVNPSGGSYPRGNTTLISWNAVNAPALAAVYPRLVMADTGEALGSLTNSSDCSTGGDSSQPVAPAGVYKWEMNIVCANWKAQAVDAGKYRIGVEMHSENKMVAVGLSEIPFAILSATSTPTSSKTIYVALDPSSPPGRYVFPGETDVGFTNVKLTAGASSIPAVAAIQLSSDSVGASSALLNIRIYEGATLVGSAAESRFYNEGYYYQWVSAGGLAIPPNSSKILRIVADIAPEGSGSRRLGVTGVSFATSSVLTVGLPVYGNFMNIASPTPPPPPPPPPPGPTSSGAPVIFFTDLESGPKTGGPSNLGAPISIFGKSFGASRGTSKVTIGGVEVASYLVWGENNAHNSHLDMIVVQPGPNVSGGSIMVTVSGKNSNTDFAFYPNGGNIYYIAPAGSDSAVCFAASPCATVLYVLGTLMKPGDVVLMRGGNYSEGEVWVRGDYGQSGTLSQRKTVKNYPGEEVYLTNAARGFIIDADYITVSGLNFQNGKSLGIAGWANPNQAGDKFVNNTFKGLISYDAVSITGNDHLIAGNVCEVSGSTVGTQGHCYYIHHGNNTKLLYNIGSSAPGYNIHLYDQRRSASDFKRVISNLLIEGNILKNSTHRSGLLIGMDDEAALGNTIDNVVVRNNIFTANNHVGLVVNGGSGVTRNVKVYNNTFYENGKQGIYIANDSGITNLNIRNNLIYQAVNANCIQLDTCSWFPLAHIQAGTLVSGLTLDHNSYHGNPLIILDGSDANPITGSVNFIDPAGLNFRLDLGSSQIDRGADLASDVPRDFDGQARPQGQAYDTGAFEYVSAGTSPPTPPILPPPPPPTPVPPPPPIGPPTPPPVKPQVSISLDPSSPPSQVIPAGRANVHFTTARATASAHDGSISTVSIAAVGDVHKGLSNIKLHDAATATLLGTLPKLPNVAGNGAWGSVFFGSPLVIPNGTWKSLQISADVASSTSGSVRVGVVSLGSNQPIIFSGIPVYGNAMTIAAATSSPAATQQMGTALESIRLLLEQLRLQLR